MPTELFKTYRLRKHEDARGWLQENIDPQICQHINHFFISESAPNVIRGNHYHKRKREWFIVIQGEAEAHFIDPQSNEKNKITLNSNDPIIIETIPHIPHAIKNTGPEKLTLLAFVNEKFNPEDPDTYPYQVLTD